MSEELKPILQYYPFSSVIDIGFWHLLANKKLETFKLDDKPIDINATFNNDLSPNLPSLLNINYDSFEENNSFTKETHKMFGKLIVTNTFEDFLIKDKKQLITELGKEIWSNIIEDNVIKDISRSLSKFLLLVFADLKKYRFHYWFAFPALSFPQKTYLTKSAQTLSSIWTKNQISSFYEETNSKLDEKNSSYFIVFEEDSEITVHTIAEYSSLKEKQSGKIHFSFADSCPSDQYPGWPLRNYLAFICFFFKLNECSIISYKRRAKSVENSIIFEVEMDSSNIPDIDSIQCFGWEKNENNKLMHRVVDLSTILDPIRLAENAVDLNLKLMRWRLVPSLDLEKISSARCLILGSGTLGCYVARGLMAWGIKTITFVDNSHISYSNPVRQSLFTFEDCLDGGKHKAMAAADALKRIFPNTNSKGISLSIPMPGHPVMDHMITQIKNDVEVLNNLIDENDVIFLLMDTRESRWLPTVLSSVKNKLVINAALGFDTFLVQRHGVRSSTSNELNISKPSYERSKIVLGSQLGCYFCNDVVAPANSTKDRTLDQQCTVTRPGVSMIASGIAVELLVSLLQHPLGGEAPALTVNADDYYDENTETSLGLVPHQIRGFLSRFQQLMPTSERFDKCSACSDSVINAYKKDGFDFLLKAFNDSNYIEELTGLTQLHNETNLQDIWVLSDSEDDNSQ